MANFHIVQECRSKIIINFDDPEIESEFREWVSEQDIWNRNACRCYWEFFRHDEEKVVNWLIGHNIMKID